MKTATITWSSYYNYGTELQAYALQQFLNMNDIDNEIISDSDIISNQENLPEACYDSVINIIKKSFYRPLTLFRRLHGFGFYRPHYKSFLLLQQFKKKELNILYNISKYDMSSLNSRYDMFICGSDQIWSVLDHNFNGYFFLDFVTKPKISYAPSIGTINISSEKMKKIAHWLSDFSAISVREKQSALQLHSALNRPIDFVSDPTLLHNREFWHEFSQGAKIHKKKKYILCYFLSNYDWYFEYAKKLSSALNLEIILIPNKIQYIENGFRYNRGVGPREFVALIESANFVLTDSYHGSIFSLIFEKQFLCFKRFSDNEFNNQNIRLDSLFSYLKIEDLIIPQKQFHLNDLKEINYSDITTKLDIFRQHSRKFLLENIGKNI